MVLRLLSRRAGAAFVTLEMNIGLGALGRGQLVAAIGAGLLQHAADMCLDGAARYEQLLCYVVVGEAGVDQLKDFGFPGGDAESDEVSRDVGGGPGHLRADRGQRLAYAMLQRRSPAAPKNASASRSQPSAARIPDWKAAGALSTVAPTPNGPTCSVSSIRCRRRASGGPIEVCVLFVSAAGSDVGELAA